MVKAYSFQTRILVQMPGNIPYRLERRDGCGGAWLVLADSGFIADDGAVTPIPVTGNYLDENVIDGICQYRVQDLSDDTGEWDYTVWFKSGSTDPVGYTFGNYEAPEGSWGNIITTDDLRYTYLWGVDFRASNGASYTDAQIQFFIDAALADIQRQLNITVKKTRVICEPAKRGLKKGKDYDVAEDFYTFRRERVMRNGFITTRKRPIIEVTRLDLINRNDKLINLLNATTVDHTKGQIKYFNRPFTQSDTGRGVETALYPHGAETIQRNLFYAIDYVAGFENSDEVPIDLRQIIGKVAAVSLLNNIGRGLMSGFSSSSVSMDGMSESFSSTQSATSAYYGADVKEYKDDIDRFIAENRLKFGHIVMGAI